ncbi:MAG: fosfomycin resistance glutathione transferase [Pseudomonadota bacterium]
MIRGINHITLAVSDLDVSVRFYEQVLGFRLASRYDGGAYFEAGSDWLCLSLDDAARDQSRSDYTHVAFDVSEEDFDAFLESLRAANVPIWKQNRSEGQSIYFLDPDGHKLEIHVGSLQSRLAAMDGGD